MIIYIYGEDTFRSHEYLKEQVAKFKTARDPQGYNVVFVSAAKAEAAKVMSEIMAAPFLAEKRMVVVENVLSSSDKGLLGELIGRINGVIPAQAGIQSSRSPIKSGMTVKHGFPESNIIVFYQSEPLSKVKEAKEMQALLEKEKYAKKFESLVGAQLIAWINSEIKNRGGKISGAASQYLAANVAGDMWHLNSLLDQLVAYSHLPVTPPQAGGDKKEIQLVDIQLFLEEKIDDNVFNLTDAIIAGNHKLAFKLLDGQRQLGVDDAQIFGAVIWQFRVLVSMRDLFERADVKSDDMAKTLKIHPFVVKKNLAVVKKYSLEKLKQIYNHLLEVDIKVKTGYADQAILMDLFVASV